MAKVTVYTIVKHYCTVTCTDDTLDEFNNEITAALAEGWELQGGPLLIDDHNSSNVHLIGQAVTRNVKV